MLSYLVVFVSTNRTFFFITQNPESYRASETHVMVTGTNGPGIGFVTTQRTHFLPFVTELANRFRRYGSH